MLQKALFYISFQIYIVYLYPTVLEVPLDEILRLSSAKIGSEKFVFSKTASVTVTDPEYLLVDVFCDASEAEVVEYKTDAGIPWDVVDAVPEVTATAVVTNGEEEDELIDESLVKTRAGGRREPFAEVRLRTQVWPREGGAEAEMFPAAEWRAGLSVTVVACCCCWGCCAKTFSSIPLSWPFSKASVVDFSFRAL